MYQFVFGSNADITKESKQFLRNHQKWFEATIVDLIAVEYNEDDIYYINHSMFEMHFAVLQSKVLIGTFFLK